MQWVATILFLLVGLVNFAPIVGALSTGRLQSLYGLSLSDPNLVILLRHRAVLLGIVGGLLLASAFVEALRPLAAALGLVSMLSYFLIVFLVGGSNPELRRIAMVDLAASAALIAAWWIGNLDHARRIAA